MTQPEEKPATFDPLSILLDITKLENGWSQPNFVLAQIGAAEVILRLTTDTDLQGNQAAFVAREKAFEFLRKVATGAITADNTAKVRAISVYTMTDRERSK